MNQSPNDDEKADGAPPHQTRGDCRTTENAKKSLGAFGSTSLFKVLPQERKMREKAPNRNLQRNK